MSVGYKIFKPHKHRMLLILNVLLCYFEKKKNNANMFSKGNLKLEIKNLFGNIKFVSVFPRSSIFIYFYFF